MSYQVLMENGLINNEKVEGRDMGTQPEDERLKNLFDSIADVFLDQYQNWQKKRLFEKQFILSDFKKQMGLPADSFKIKIEMIQSQIQNKEWNNFSDCKTMFIKWQGFYEHQIELLKNYEKDATQLKRDTDLLNSWVEILQEIIRLMR